MKNSESVCRVILRLNTYLYLSQGNKNARYKNSSIKQEIHLKSILELDFYEFICILVLMTNCSKMGQGWENCAICSTAEISRIFSCENANLFAPLDENLGKCLGEMPFICLCRKFHKF